VADIIRRRRRRFRASSGLTYLADAETRRYHQAIRVLLEGVCGLNTQAIHRQTTLGRPWIQRFMAGDGNFDPATVDILAAFVWRRMNANVLLTPHELGLPDLLDAAYLRGSPEKEVQAS
jgi:hypothetical protein